MGDNGMFSSQLLFMVSLPCSYLHCPPRFFRAHDESLASAGALSWELDPFHVLVKAIYRLSNNMVYIGPWQNPCSGDGLLYHVLFSRIPPSVFSIFLRIDIISTRVAWTELLDLMVTKKDFHHGVQLLRLALDYNPKLWEKMNATRFRVLQELSMCPVGTRERGIKLLTALDLEPWELSKWSLLSWAKGLGQSTKGGVLEELGNAAQYLQRCIVRNPSARERILEQLIEMGFEWNAAIQVFDGEVLSEREFRSGELARLATVGQLTWKYLTASHQQDQCRFYSFKTSFMVLHDDFVRYLRRNGRLSPLTSPLLTKIEDNPQWWTVLGRCAVVLLHAELCPCARTAWRQNPFAAWEHGLALGAVESMIQTKGAPAAVRWLDTLTERGAIVCPWILAKAVSGDGWLGGLIKLQALGADIRQHGQQAMVVAAQLGDRRAIDWLLEQGVDVNGTVPIEAGGVTIAYAAAFLGEYGGRIASLEMIEYLTGRGAKLAQHASESSSIAFVTRFLRHQALWAEVDEVETNNKKLNIPNIVSLFDAAGPSSEADSDMLDPCFEHCEWDFATQLLDRNTPPSTAVLALAISKAAPTLLLQRLLNDPRIDLNANNGNASSRSDNIPLHGAAAVFDLSLIQELVACGADLDCLAWEGSTLLMSTCKGHDNSALDAARRMEVVHYLLEHGLDVNAHDCLIPPRWETQRRPAISSLLSRSSITVQTAMCGVALEAPNPP